MRALIADCVFSKDEAPLYHADPHAGNLWATDDGRLAILDWSLVGRLEKRDRETLARITLGALRLSRRELTEGLLNLCDVPVDTESRAQIRPVVDKALRRVRRGHLPGMPWLTDLLEDAAAQGLVFPPSLVLFRKSLFTLKGVLADIDPAQSADWLFLKEAAKHFAKELPSRWISFPFSRAHSTHVSNADLVRTYLSAPLTVGRFWAGTLRDFLPSA
jgi:ubiquinone biosynthesis protein